MEYKITLLELNSLKRNLNKFLLTHNNRLFCVVVYKSKRIDTESVTLFKRKRKMETSYYLTSLKIVSYFPENGGVISLLDEDSAIQFLKYTDIDAVRNNYITLMVQKKRLVNVMKKIEKNKK